MNKLSKFSKLIYVLKTISGYKFFYLIFLMLFLAVMELFSVGLILPLLNSLYDDSFYNLFNQFSYFKNNFNINKKSFELFLFSTLLSAYLIKFLLYIYFSYLQNTYIMNIHYKTSKHIFKKYLYADYFFHIKNNTSVLIKSLKEEVRVFIFGVLMQSAIFILEFFVLILFLTFLFWYNFQITSVIVSLILIVLLIYISLIKKNIKKIGKNRFFFDQSYLQIMMEGFSSIKDIKLLALENEFINNLSKNLKKYTLSQRNFQVYQTFPKQMIELIAISILIIILIISKLNNVSINNLIITIGVYGVSAIRLMPMFSRLVSCYQQISFNHKTIDTIYSELKSSKLNYLKKNTTTKQINEKFKFKTISFENINFKYPNTKKYIFKKLNVEIKKGDKIGIFGESGIGKSTFADLITGLVKPDRGKVKFNGNDINNQIQEIRQKISYSQQNTCILDDTIIKNIILNKNKDLKLLNKISNIVQLKNFVKTSKNFRKGTGEKGIKISGGQKQRISLARSLYRKPDILILDEATNALDEKNEKAFFDNLLNNYPNITLIIISHNKKILSRCENIYEIKNSNIYKLKNK